MKTVYTDGACSGNPGPGGWAWVDVDGPFASGCENPSTNQRMEVMAVLEALRHYDAGPVTIMSDSTYVVNCFRDKWWDGWKRRGWLNAAKKPVANRDLWEPLIELYLSRRDEIAFKWVKGHGRDPMNARADELAVAASLSQRGSVAPEKPDEVVAVEPVEGDVADPVQRLFELP
ncbi:MAG TPA: ribonuclease H [Acidimicrobiales bacterium]|nr:ribonuclease H [Acidimicrobiales bacterium]